MRYRVRALDQRQQLHTVALEALDELDARTQTLSRQLAPISITAEPTLRDRSAGKFPFLIFAQGLQALLAAGLSVVEALEALCEDERDPVNRRVIGRLVENLKAGQSLSAAIRLQPDQFPPLFAGIVQAAENTSDLPGSLARYVDYELRLETVRQQVVSAAIYPAILLCVGGMVGLFLLGYVVPRFATVYESSGRDLPWASQMLIAWGKFAHANAPYLLSAVAVSVTAAFLWARRQFRDRAWWSALQLIPGSQHRLAALERSRLMLTMGMLLQGGIPVPQALRLSEVVALDQTRTTLTSVRRQVESGESLSNALERHDLVSPVAQRLLRAGERSGQLGKMLTQASSFYDMETARWITRFTKTFEPLLMAVIGVVIGLIVVLLYMPIFDLAGSLQ